MLFAVPGLDYILVGVSTLALLFVHTSYPNHFDVQGRVVCAGLGSHKIPRGIASGLWIESDQVAAAHLACQQIVDKAHLLL